MMKASWPCVPLGEVMRLSLDAHVVDPEQEYPNLGIYNFGRGAFQKPPIQGCSTSATTLYRVRSGQFIYSRLFAFEGAYTVVPEMLDGVFVSNEFPTFDLDNTILDAGYLRWWFRQPSVWTELRSDATGMGDRRQRIHPEQILAHSITLAPLPEQRRIVARLDAAAGQVEAHRRAAAAIGVELDTTLALAFRRITAGASRARMGDVAPLVRREVVIDPDASYTEIGVRSFYKGIFHRRTIKGSEFTWQKLFRVSAGDLVFSNLMAWEQAIAVALQRDHLCVGNHRMLTCQPDHTRSTSYFLDYFFKTAEGFAAVKDASPGSIARNKTLSPALLAKIEVPLPSLDAQRWFNSIGKHVGAALEQMRAAEADLAGLLPALLHRTFAGEVEPAPVMQESIAAE